MVVVVETRRMNSKEASWTSACPLSPGGAQHHRGGRRHRTGSTGGKLEVDVFLPSFQSSCSHRRMLFFFFLNLTNTLWVLSPSSRCDPATVNITDEMSKGSFGGVWKSVNPAEAAKKEPSAKRCVDARRVTCAFLYGGVAMKQDAKWRDIPLDMVFIVVKLRCVWV